MGTPLGDLGLATGKDSTMRHLPLNRLTGLQDTCAGDAARQSIAFEDGGQTYLFLFGPEDVHEACDLARATINALKSKAARQIVFKEEW
jgi:hypothetical protein